MLCFSLLGIIRVAVANKHSFNWYSHFRYFVSPDLSLKTNSIVSMLHRKFGFKVIDAHDSKLGLS